MATPLILFLVGLLMMRRGDWFANWAYPAPRRVPTPAAPADAPKTTPASRPNPRAKS
jgi:hypothetical protein